MNCRTDGLRVISVAERPSADVFQRELVSASVPALFAGGASGDGEKWSVAALAARFPDRQVAVRESATTQFAIDPVTGRPPAPASMMLGELARAISAGERHLYLMQQPVAKVFPELLSELPLPEYVPVAELQSLNLWIGQAGNITRLHWDNYNNLLVQLWGRKRVLLMPPDAPALSPAPVSRSRAPHQVNLESPIMVRDEASGGIRCVLNPGDFLFIPAFWWHEVESLDAAVSANAWWKAAFEQCFVEPALAALRSTPPDPEYILFYFRSVRWDGSLWQAAELARDKGVEWLCRRILAAAVQADVTTVCRKRGVAPVALHDAAADDLDRLETAAALPSGSGRDLAAFFRSSRDTGSADANRALVDLFAHARRLSACIATP